MTGKIYIGITDHNWYEYLRRRPDLDEVNFWQPGGSRQFRVLKPGELFLFKLHAPNDFIVGGGIFTHSTLLSCSLAWEAFGDKNGAPTLEVMRRRIEQYRKVPQGPSSDYTIGNILLSSPFFFDRADWIPVPESWHPNIVQGKSYGLDSSAGREIWREVSERIPATSRSEPIHDTEYPMYGDPVLIQPRLGQGGFRILVTDIYQRHCAVTGEKTLPVLDAAHIRPVSQGGRHQVQNGILMRTDIHRLFDGGYVSVTPDYRFRVSRRIKEDFDNGEPYYALQGRSIWLPKQPQENPKPELLEWHSDEVFLG